MLVFHSQKLVYLAVPKTGTTAVENALGASASSVFRNPPGLKHANARRFEREFRPILEKSGQRTFKTVAAIREPLDWLASWYRYRTRPAIAGHPNSTRDISFDAFIEAYLSEDQPPFAKVGSQARFLTDTDGKVLVDHVFPYERLKEMIAFLEARLRIETTIETVNASPSLEIDLDSGLDQELRMAMRPDFELHEAALSGGLK